MCTHLLFDSSDGIDDISDKKFAHGPREGTVGSLVASCMTTLLLEVC